VGKKSWLWIAPGVAIAALLAAPRVARAFKQWEQAQRQAILQQARAAVAAGADGLPDLTPLLDPDASPSDPDSRDNAELRSLAMAAELGPRTPQTQQMLLQIAAQERVKFADPFGVPAGVSSPGTRTWRSIGPQAARTEFNGTFYKAMYSGRPTALAMHPTDSNTVFLATSGGGLWSARDFNSNMPTWTPLTETLGSLAVGAFAIAPTVGPGGTLTIWLGLGDAFDQQSGVVVKGTWTTDPLVAGNPPTGSAIWGAPIVLATAVHPADGQPSSALNVRDIKIDPGNPNHVLVATNEGLYQSIDGASFSLVDLPNSIGNTRESTWQIVYLGSAAGQSQWLVSGVYACPKIAGMALAPSPPAAAAGVFSCPGDPTHFNAGDLWKSVDSGVTWTSARIAGAFPSPITTDVRLDVGRIALGAG